jgi:hypothetical protein
VNCEYPVTSPIHVRSLRPALQLTASQSAATIGDDSSHRGQVDSPGTVFRPRSVTVARVCGAGISKDARDDITVSPPEVARRFETDCGHPGLAIARIYEQLFLGVLQAVQKFFRSPDL